MQTNENKLVWSHRAQEISFSTKLCEYAEETAKTIYLKDLPPQCIKSKHEEHLQKSLKAFEFLMEAYHSFV